MVSFKSSPWPKYTQYGTISQKNQVLLSTFFSASNMLFIRLFLANTLKINWGLPGVVSSQTVVKCGHVLGGHSRDGELAR